MPHYAVVNGRRPGIYSSWSDCSEQVNGYSQAHVRKFSEYSQAADYLYSQVIIVYTDGSAIKNGHADARAGYGVWFENPNLKDCNEAARVRGDIQTSNRGELSAMISAVRMSPEDGRDLVICSDSQYAMNTVGKWMKKWRYNTWKNAKGKEVANRDLIEEFDGSIGAWDGKVLFKYVPAHTGVMGNEKADRMAKHGAMMPRRDI